MSWSLTERILRKLVVASHFPAFIPVYAVCWALGEPPPKYLWQ